MPQPSVTDVSEEISALEKLKLPELRTRWASEYGSPPPRAARALYLLRGIAYRIQEKAFGGLSAAVVRRLEKLAPSNNRRRTEQPSQRMSLKAGSRLLREWQGNTYEVTVIETGYLYQNQSYKSLSEIARLITGTRWSGPLFFGLKRKQKGSEQGQAQTFVVDLTTGRKRCRTNARDAQDTGSTDAR